MAARLKVISEETEEGIYIPQWNENVLILRIRHTRLPPNEQHMFIKRLKNLISRDFIILGE